MVAHFLLSACLAASAMCLVEGRGEDPAVDPLQEGIRLLDDDGFGWPTQDDFEAKAKRNLDAKETLSRAVTAQPNDPTSRAWYALSLLRSFEKDEALREAEAAVRLGPETAIAYRVRGLVHAGREEHEKALDDLNQAVRLDPREAANLRTRGEYFAGRHQSERAFADYAVALEVDRHDAKTYLLRAMLHMEAANVDLAMKDFDAAILARPDLTALRGARGILRMYKKDYAGVVDDLGAALERRPDGEMFLMRGFALAELNRHEEAIHDFDEAIRLESNSKLLLARGLSYQKLDRLERAFQDFGDAVKMSPEAASFVTRGLLLEKLGRREKAADDLNEAIQREPDNGGFHLARGNLFLEPGREEAALADYDEAVRLDPDEMEPLYLRGGVRLIAGREGAGDDFRAVLRVKGWRHELSMDCALFGYAADLLAGRPAAGRALIEQALSRCDPAAWPYPLLRCLHGELKEPEALAAATDDPQKTQARFFLGIMSLTEGRHDAGLRNLRDVCDHGDPSSRMLKIARAVLQREGRDRPATSK